MNIKGAEALDQESSTLVLRIPNELVLCTSFEGSVASTLSNIFDFADKNTRETYERF